MAVPSVLAVVTARGGSKGIPGKNIRCVAGKPLIAWTLDCAARSERVGRILVSTDSEAIADVAREWGAEVPFLRPEELAQDDSPHVPVLLHALDWLQRNEDFCPDHVLLLQPTSPLRSTQDIDGAIALAAEKGADAVVSVSEALSHPRYLRSVAEDGRLLSPDCEEGEYLPRQSLRPAYVLNGAIYLVRSTVLRERETFYTERTYAYVMPQERSLDIDSPWQLHLADVLLSGGV
ncbi:acylneuraminate cytidylyltransferase family protein [Candidatus Bipolaricaulota bacterium]|nr:acylneuraminate cytidylyltransferase family protein [Candidatus Bipolaricaulota bacterium]